MCVETSCTTYKEDEDKATLIRSTSKSVKPFMLQAVPYIRRKIYLRCDKTFCPTKSGARELSTLPRRGDGATRLY